MRISDYEFMYLLKEFDERLESQGLDEANLDVTDYLIANGLNSAEGAGQNLKHVETGRTGHNFLDTFPEIMLSFIYDTLGYTPIVSGV